MPHYPKASPRRPGHNHRGQEISPQANRSRRGPEPTLTPATPGRRRSHPGARPSTEAGGMRHTFGLDMKPKNKRHRRSFTAREKAQIKAVREARACQPCHDGHRKVYRLPSDIKARAIILADARKCTHKVLPADDIPTPEEHSPHSDAGPVTPASAGQENDFILFDSSQESGADSGTGPGMTDMTDAFP